MDFTAALKHDILRPLGTTFIPAAAALAPCAWILLTQHPEFLTYYKDNATVMNVVVLAALFVIGMYFEDIGSRLEQLFYRCIKVDKDSDRAWTLYLKSNPTKLPIGTDYLMSLVARMKFELSMIPAIIVGTAAGLGSAASTGRIPPFTWGFWLWILSAVLLLGYTIWEVWGSVVWLDKQRRAVYIGKHDEEKDPASATPNNQNIVPMLVSLVFLAAALAWVLPRLGSTLSFRTGATPMVPVGLAIHLASILYLVALPAQWGRIFKNPWGFTVFLVIVSVLMALAIPPAPPFWEARLSGLPPATFQLFGGSLLVMAAAGFLGIHTRPAFLNRQWSSVGLIATGFVILIGLAYLCAAWPLFFE